VNGYKVYIREHNRSVFNYVWYIVYSVPIIISNTLRKGSSLSSYKSWLCNG